MSDENNIPLENAPTTPQWETMDAWVFTRFFATVRGVFFHPVQFFKSFRADGDYLAPILYVLLLSSIIIILSIILYFPIALLLGDILFIGAEGMDERLFPVMILFGLCIVIFPLIMPLSLFFSAKIIHSSARLFGAANKPYKATFRIMVYLFTIELLLVIPFIGPLLVGVCQPVYLTIALREVHQTTTFRAACVVLFPILLALLLFMWFLYAFFLPLSRGMFFSY